MKTAKRILATMLVALLLVTSAPLADMNCLFTQKAEASYSVGDYIQYGNYPQSIVNDSATLSILNSKTKNWVSYRYYSGSGTLNDGKMVPSDYMYYCDLDTNGDGLRDYRAVRFDEYRPNHTGNILSSDEHQATTGCTPGTTYYFKYEPILWRILDPNDGLILTENIIDSQAYNNYIISSGNYYYGDSAKSFYANDYYNSSIRQWLNNDFYNTAFNSSQANNIRNDVSINNNCYDSSYPLFNSKASKDKMFLLSYEEITNSAYGFSSDVLDTTDFVRRTQGTSYARAQNLYVYTDRVYKGYSWWWLRSSDYYSISTCCINVGGTLSTCNVGNTYNGVRVACRLSNLLSDISRSKIGNNIGSGLEESSKTYFKIGKLKDYIITVILNGNGSYVSGITIDENNYTVKPNLINYSLDSYINTNVYILIYNNEIIEFRPLSTINTSANAYITGSDLSYQNGKYKIGSKTVKKMDLTVTLSNNTKLSVDKYNSLKDYNELEVYVDKVRLSLPDNSTFNFDGKLDLDLPFNGYLKYGSSFNKTIEMNINSNYKIASNIEHEEITVFCEVIGLNDRVINRSDIKITVKNNNYSLPSQNSDSNVNELAYIASSKINNASSAIYLGDLYGLGDLGKIFDNNQLNVIKELIVTEMVMSTISEDKYSEAGLSKKIIEKIFKCDTDLISIKSNAIEFTVAAQVKINDYFKTAKIKFICEFDRYGFNGSSFGNYGKISYELLGGLGQNAKQELIKAGIRENGEAGYTVSYNIKAFCDAVYNYAESALKSAYDMGYGKDADKAVDFIFGESVNKILGYSNLKSVSNTAWKLMIMPSKSISVKCPVDIYIYNKSDELVGSIENNTVTLSNENVELAVNGDTKTIVLYGDDYYLVYEPTANGKMELSVKEYGSEDSLLRTVNINDVQLEIGNIYKQEIDDEYIENSDYTLTDSNSNIIPVSTDEINIHSCIIDEDFKEEYQATCTFNGYKYSQCTICNKWLFEMTDEAIGHTYTETTTNPTCTEPGYTTYTCTVCGDTQQKEIPATNHPNKYGTKGLGATCTEDGFTGGIYCPDCKEYLSGHEVLKAEGHKAIVYSEMVPPTCTADGHTAETRCKTCGEVMIKSKVIPAIGHSDKNNDGFCDNCGTDLGTHNPADNCSHICHKTGFAGFIWKILNLFNKMFKTNKVCECGAKHY